MRSERGGGASIDAPTRLSTNLRRSSMTLGGSTSGLAATHIFNLPPEIHGIADEVSPFTGAGCVVALTWTGLRWLSEHGYLRASLEIGRRPTLPPPVTSRLKEEVTSPPKEE